MPKAVKILYRSPDEKHIPVQCSNERSHYAHRGGMPVHHGPISNNNWYYNRYFCSAEGCGLEAVAGGACFYHGGQNGLFPNSHANFSQSAAAEPQASTASAVPKKKGTPANNEAREYTLELHNGVWLSCYHHKPKSCSIERCEKYAVRDGVCVNHGAKLPKICSVDGCSHLAIDQATDLCTHNKRQGQCKIIGCHILNRYASFCHKHSVSKERSKQLRLKCSNQGCNKLAAHDGACSKPINRCAVEGCNIRVGFKSKHNMCKRHRDNAKFTAKTGITQAENSSQTNSLGQAEENIVTAYQAATANAQSQLKNLDQKAHETTNSNHEAVAALHTQRKPNLEYTSFGHNSTTSKGLSSTLTPAELVAALNAERAMSRCLYSASTPAELVAAVEAENLQDL